MKPQPFQIDDIHYTFYGEWWNVHPNDFEINNAYVNKQFENRNFQLCYIELRSEWERKANGECYIFFKLAKEYHCQRIAYFVNEYLLGNLVNNHPICGLQNGNSIVIKDGLHRVLALKFLANKFPSKFGQVVEALPVEN